MREYFHAAATVRCAAMKILPIALLAATTTIASSANADTMYKCTDQNGKVSYSDQPCTGKSKAATLTVIAPQHKAGAEDEWDSLQRRVPLEPESESDRLKRAEADFQERRKRREEADDAEAEYSRESRRAYQVAERLKPKIDPKQTTLSIPTWRQQAREAKKREEEEKRRRDALLPSIH